jgi:hypothetical protein
MKNECRCPSPPGGIHRCPADQLAICKVVDGQLETDCLTPPEGAMKSKATLTQWVLMAVMGESRAFRVRFRSSIAIRMALRHEGQGEILDARGNRVNFRLSEEMIRVLVPDDDKRRSRKRERA